MNGRSLESFSAKSELAAELKAERRRKRRRKKK